VMYTLDVTRNKYSRWFIPMSNPQIAFRIRLLRALFSLAAQSLLILAGGISCRAQSAETLSQVKKVYVESFGQDDQANSLRERMINQLRKSRKLEVVTAANQADAIIKGSGSVWVTGYVSTSPRTPSITRRPISYGFLSAEIVGKNDETLWSYLVTPSKFRAGSVTQDLADHLVTKLLGALEQKSESVSESPVTERAGEMHLDAAGASFPAPLYQKWFVSFQQRYPKAHINYNSVGSEAGIRLLADGKVDFAASDVPLSDERMSESRKSLLHFATALGAVVPIYNLKGVERSLNFTPDALAGIYQGKIQRWNDPKLRESNKSAPLPNSDIVVIHRSDGSGTTFVWTDYLSKVSPDWKTTVGSGTSVKWPVGTGAEGNESVAALVQRTPNSIGYVELVYALRHQLSVGAVRNAAGEFVQADLASVSTAARGAAGAMTSDFRVSITNAQEKRAYPISSFTWWLLPAELGGADKKPAFLELLEWMLTSGQKECSALGYAPLPHEIASRELQFLTKLK
jgi:phosphate transport system substrate-binding protein